MTTVTKENADQGIVNLTTANYRHTFIDDSIRIGSHAAIAVFINPAAIDVKVTGRSTKLDSNRLQLQH